MGKIEQLLYAFSPVKRLSAQLFGPYIILYIISIIHIRRSELKETITTLESLADSIL